MGEDESLTIVNAEQSLRLGTREPCPGVWSTCVAGSWRLVPLLLLLLVISGEAAPLAQADASLTFQDLGTVLTGADVGLPGLTSPSAAALPRAGPLYYSPLPGSGAGVFSAISTDGVHFTPEPGRRWAPTLQGDVEHLPDARYRMYVAARETNLPPPPRLQVYSAVSSDLSTWSLEPGIRRIGGGKPGTLLNPDGSTMLVFGCACGPGGAMQTASSTDGLVFAPPAATNLVGDSPTFATLPGGRLLMYYTRGDPPTINAAVVVRVDRPIVSYPAQAVTAVTAKSARLSATVDPQGADTDYAFDYGTSIDYGQTTDRQSIPAAGGPQIVSATVTGLSPATAYHFRLVASNAVGVTVGADQTFRTGGCRLGPKHAGGWEVALAQTRTPAAARKVLTRARALAGSRAWSSATAVLTTSRRSSDCGAGLPLQRCSVERRRSASVGPGSSARSSRTDLVARRTHRDSRNAAYAPQLSPAGASARSSGSQSPGPRPPSQAMKLVSAAV